MESHDGVDNGRDDRMRDAVVYRTVHAGSKLLLLFDRGHFADQRAHIRCQIAWKISDRHLWKRNPAVLYVYNTVHSDSILSPAVSAGQDARLETGILPAWDSCVSGFVQSRMALRGAALQVLRFLKDLNNRLFSCWNLYIL